MMLVGLLCVALQLEHFPATPWESLCRGRDLPPAPWADPADGFRFEGRVRFGDGENAIQQEVEFWLGGPTRGRYLLRNGINKVLILQSNRKDGWFFHSEEKAFEAMPLTHLSPETWLRWTVCRFPWGFEEALAGWDPKKDKPFPTLPGRNEELQVELGQDGRPTLWKMGAIELKVADWKPVRNAGLQPHRWNWTVDGDRREELFESIEGRVLHFDAAFRPPDADPPQSNLSAPLQPGQLQAPPGGFGLVNLPNEEWISLPPSNTIYKKLRDGGWIRPLHWLVFEKGNSEPSAFFSPATHMNKPPPNLARRIPSPSGLHLRWTCWNSAAPADLSQTLFDTARQSDLKPVGSVLIAPMPADGRAHHRTLLLKVERKKKKEIRFR